MKKINKPDPILKYILDQETEKFKSIVYFEGADKRQADELITLIRGFAVTVSLRFAKIEFIKNTILFIIAAALAYKFAQYIR